VNRESFESLRHLASVACEKKRLARRLWDLGCPPSVTLGDIQAKAERDLRRINVKARPFIASGGSLNPRKSQT